MSKKEKKKLELANLDNLLGEFGLDNNINTVHGGKEEEGEEKKGEDEGVGDDGAVAGVGGKKKKKKKKKASSASTNASDPDLPEDWVDVSAPPTAKAEDDINKNNETVGSTVNVAAVLKSRASVKKSSSESNAALTTAAKEAKAKAAKKAEAEKKKKKKENKDKYPRQR